MGLFGAVVKGVSVRAAPLEKFCFGPDLGAGIRLPSASCGPIGLTSLSLETSISSGVLAPSELGVDSWPMMADLAMAEC